MSKAINIDKFTPDGLRVLTAAAQEAMRSMISTCGQVELVGVRLYFEDEHGNATEIGFGEFGEEKADEEELEEEPCE